MLAAQRSAAALEQHDQGSLIRYAVRAHGRAETVADVTADLELASTGTVQLNNLTLSERGGSTRPCAR